MAVKRRLVKQWNALKPAYRKRLERSGISRADYLSGTPLAAARGHSLAPEHPGRNTIVTQALRSSLLHYVPDDVWAAMSPADRMKVAKNYILGYFTKGQGTELTRDQKDARGILPKDKRIYRHRSREQFEAQVEFQQFMVEVNGKDWDKEDWNYYKTDAYYSTFSNAA